MIPSSYKNKSVKTMIMINLAKLINKQASTPWTNEQKFYKTNNQFKYF